MCLAVAGGVAMTTKSSVVYIDSGWCFSLTWLTQMLAAKGLNNEVIRYKLYWKSSNARSMLLFIPSKWLYRVLQRIRVFQVTDIFQLLSLLGTLGKNIAEEIDCSIATYVR